ncbi:MAG: methionyl-tRNA formyltransferase [Deltaproteobacteria bacterium]|nr:methionyl-tRNA formyltransferase [Deltaproteobacteria bacterium]
MNRRVPAKPRVVFFGTPEFSVPCLKFLSEISHLILVISQPDRPSGRGLKLTPPAIKRTAEQLGIPVIQPVSVRTTEFVRTLREAKPDLGVVVAYGRILPLAVLEAPRLGCVNLHASLLPKYRGAAPIQWSIINGEAETGVSLMRMDEGMDSGPVLAAVKTPIDPDENAAELSERLARMGGELLRDRFLSLMQGELQSVEQARETVSYAPMLRKSDGKIVWDRSARATHDFVRGMNPWPGAFSWLGGKRITLHRTSVTADEGNLREPGAILHSDDRGIEVACGSGAILIEEVQVEGKRRMSVEQFLTGNRISMNARFSAAV